MVLRRYKYNNEWYTMYELVEMSGISECTIRDRLRRGYTMEEALKDVPIHESVKAFDEASSWEDWIGMSINDLYTIYMNWCISNEYDYISKQGFSRHLKQLYPILKTVPIKSKTTGECNRIIRLAEISDISNISEV